MESYEPTGRLVLLRTLEGRSTVAGAVLRGLARPTQADRPARVVLLSVGSREWGWSEAFRRSGAADVRSLVVADRNDAGNARILALIERSTAVVLGGDDPGRVFRLMVDTRLDAALRRLAGSVVVLGTGPGGSALAGGFLEDGETLTGLGYLPGAIVDPRYGEDGCLDRLHQAIAEEPGSIGLGVEDGTALIVEGGAIEVLGRGSAVVVSASGESGRPARTLRHLLAEGDRFDLRTRTSIPRRPGADGSG